MLESNPDIPSTCTPQEHLTASKDLPRLPISVPLPPQEELEEFDIVLQAAIDELQTLAPLSAHDLATMMLEHLAHVADITACIAATWPEFWSMIVHGAKLLCSAREDIGVGVKNYLISALEQVVERWGEEQGRFGGVSTAELARIIGGTFDEEIQTRKMLDDRLGEVSVRWLEGYHEKLQKRKEEEEAEEEDNDDEDERDTDSGPDPVYATVTAKPGKDEGKEQRALRVLTLTPSSTILDALVSILANRPDLIIHLSILSSEDGHSLSLFFSGISSALRSRLRTTLFPVQAVGTASQSIDVLILTADCISTRGGICSEVGSLGAAICVKSLSPSAKIVVLSSAAAITSTIKKDIKGKSGAKSWVSYAWATDIRGALHVGLNDRVVDVVGKLCEWVPTQFIDHYITEEGVLGLSGLNKAAEEAGKLERYILGDGNYQGRGEVGLETT